MPPGCRSLPPCTPNKLSFLPPLPHRHKRVGVVRARAVGCLTEPGIVCFRAVRRSKHERMSKTQGSEALRGQRRSSGGPCPDHADSRTTNTARKTSKPQGREAVRGLRRSSGRPCPDHADTRTTTSPRPPFLSTNQPFRLTQPPCIFRLFSPCQKRFSAIVAQPVFSSCIKEVP